MKQSICMLGEGAWGTSMSLLLAHNGHRVNLWCYHEEVAREIQKTRFNQRYLPGIKIDDHIYPMTDIKKAISGATVIFEAIPTEFLRSVVERVMPYYDPEKQSWVVLSKGIEDKTLLLPGQIIQQLFGPESDVKITVVTGPSFAQDVARQKMTAVVVAADDCTRAKAINELLANHYFKTYLSMDIIGTQAAAAFKNVIAVGVGLVSGAGGSDNTRAYIITRGLQEMALFVQALGGKPQTVSGLAGVGDLILTCMGGLSRNIALGEHFARGASLREIEEQLGALPEGINTLKSVYEIMQRDNFQLPVCAGIFDIIFNNKSVSDVLDELMEHPFEIECLV